MKNINNINKTIKYNKLINLIESRFKDSLKIKLDINNKKLFSLYTSFLGLYNLYIGETKEQVYYIEFEAGNLNSLNILNSHLVHIDKNYNSESFWEKLINSADNFTYICDSNEFFSIHKELL